MRALLDIVLKALALPRQSSPTAAARTRGSAPAAPWGRTSLVGSVLLLAGLLGDCSGRPSKTCQPSCRPNYVCIDGACISACNPVCPPSLQCISGACVADVLDASADVARDSSDTAAQDALPDSQYAAPDVGSPCVPKPPSLVAWWRAEGDARDSVGANHGTVQGQVTFETGEVGQAFRFDGASFINIQETPALDFGPGDFTLVVWARFASLSDEVTIFQKSIGAYPDDRTYALEAFPDSYRFVIRQGTGNENDLYASVSPVVGAFEHVAAVRSGDTLRLYRNGVQISEQTNGSAIDSGSGGVTHIGSLAAEAPAVWQRYVDGDLDEISLFSRALAPAEIEAIFQAGAGGICP